MPGEKDDTLDSSTSTPTETPVQAPADNEQVPASKPEDTAEPITPAMEEPQQKAKEPPPKPEAKDSKPDPVQAVIAKLAKADPAQPAAKPAPPPKPDAKATPSPKAAAGDEAPKAEDPLEGFSDDERKVLNRKTEARIRQLHKEAKEAREALSKGGEIANPIHKEMVSILDDPAVKGEVQFVGKDDLRDLITVQGAVNRSAIAVRQGRRPAAQDVETIRLAHEWMTGKVAGLVGITPKVAPAATLRPFDGTLPQEYRDLVDIHGLAEADVRMLAAIKLQQTKQTPTQHEEAPRQEAAMPADAPEGVDMEAIYHERLISTFEGDGVGRGRGEAYRRSLGPTVLTLVQGKFPGVTKDDARSIFAALPPEDKFSYYLQAHQRVKVSSSRPSNPSPPPPPTRAPITGGTPRSVGTASSDPVEAAIARLARPE